MKRYAVIIAAALLAILAAGCAAIETVDINSDDIAYSRMLYPDGEFLTDEDEEEDSEEYYDEEIIEEEPTEHESEEKPGEKKAAPKESKQESKKAESSSKASSAPKASSAASSKAETRVSSAASSKALKRTTYRQSELRAKNSDTDSTADTDDLTDSDIVKEPHSEVKTAVFTKNDLSYDAGKYYLDLGDKEVLVYSAMGEPLEESVSEDGLEKTLKYEDCVLTLRFFEDKEAFRLTNIIVPYESMYETEKIVATESKKDQVIRAYGEPTEIEWINGPFDTEIDENESSEEESEPLPVEDTDTEDGDSETENSDTESEPGEMSGTDSESVDRGAELCVYVYRIDTKSLRLTIEDGVVIEMEYRWEF